jgi:rubrerythrin
MKPTPEVWQAIETAIQAEKDGLAFYTRAARETGDPGGQRMFQSLAADEAAHLKLFEAVRESLRKQDAWLSLEQVAAISPKRSTRPLFFPVADKRQGVKVPQRQLDALQRGIRVEDESIAFYTEQQRQANDPDCQAMYAYLVEQEESHRTILQGEYDYLSGTGYWFDMREFDLEAPG